MGTPHEIGLGTVYDEKLTFGIGMLKGDMPRLGRVLEISDVTQHLSRRFENSFASFDPHTMGPLGASINRAPRELSRWESAQGGDGVSEDTLAPGLMPRPHQDEQYQDAVGFGFRLDQFVPRPPPHRPVSDGPLDLGAPGVGLAAGDVGIVLNRPDWEGVRADISPLAVSSWGDAGNLRQNDARANTFGSEHFLQEPAGSFVAIANLAALSGPARSVFPAAPGADVMADRRMPGERGSGVGAGTMGGASSMQSDAQDGRALMVQGDVYLDGNRVGHWIGRQLERSANRPLSSGSHFDTRQSPSWSGTAVGI